MDHRRTANEIIRLLMLDLKGDSRQVSLMEECCSRGDWVGAIAHCQRWYIEASDELQLEAEYWKGISYMCIGAHNYTEGRLIQAISWLRSSEQIFEYENYWYGKGIALMGWGKAHHALKQQKQALRLYEQSHRVFQGLQEQYPGTYLYHALCGRLQSMIDEIKEPRGLHFIPLVGEAAAGEPLYVPGENSQNPTDEIVLDGTRYQLLTLGERKPKDDFVLRPGNEYFVITVRGDSMIGANINHGDQLLIKKQDSWPELREIAVFWEKDSGAMVKIFNRIAHRIYLESANYRYRPRIYDKDSPTLKTIGVVVAILEEVGE